MESSRLVKTGSYPFQSEIEVRPVAGCFAFLIFRLDPDICLWIFIIHPTTKIAYDRHIVNIMLKVEKFKVVLLKSGMKQEHLVSYIISFFKYY